MAEKYGKDYFYGKKESNYFNYEKIIASKRFKNVISFIKNNDISGRFLDIGCAFGLLLAEVSPFFTEIYGLDVSEFAIKKAKEIIPRAYLEIVDIEKSLPYPDDFFNCITALDVLEHTKKFKKNFRKIVKKLIRNGYFIVSVPIDAWPRKLFNFLDKDKTHISILKETELIDIVEKNKLKILSRRHYCPFPIFERIPYIPAEVELILKKE